jgi:hypothetical protein
VKKGYMKYTPRQAQVPPPKTDMQTAGRGQNPATNIKITLARMRDSLILANVVVVVHLFNFFPTITTITTIRPV